MDPKQRIEVSELRKQRLEDNQLEVVVQSTREERDTELKTERATEICMGVPLSLS